MSSCSYLGIQRPKKTRPTLALKHRMSNKSSASNTSVSDESPGPKTDYAYTQPHGGMKGFMESHGLKLSNDDDIQEAKAILDGYREVDTATSEADKANSK